MNTQSSTSCPQCGAALPADAPQGLCPRCLGALNFATETLPPEAMPVPPRPPLPPEELAPHFPQLEILECLGRGGMGVVYKARQKSLNRLVALKLLAPERADDAKFAERFEREAQALAALSHPHIVTIHDFGQAGGFYFLLMEFVDGVNLRQAMSAGRFTPEQALAIVPPVCEALQYAHERGIVHRDIKPENLLLDKEGRVKIADFGIAKMLGSPPQAAVPVNPPPVPAEDSMPQSGMEHDVTTASETRSQAVGTPAYAAPEQQSDPAHVDHRADIYSLGVVLYELLTGELPPAQGLPPPGLARRVQIDVRLEEVVLRALETRPELRFPTAAEFHTRLAQAQSTAGLQGGAGPAAHDASTAGLQGGAGPAAHDASTAPAFVPPPPPRLPRWAGIAGMVCGLLLLLGASLLNVMVENFGLTATARQHLAQRTRAEQKFAEAKRAATEKAAKLAQARTTADADGALIQRLNQQREAAEIGAFQAQAALNATAALEEAAEHRRIALICVLGVALLSAGGLILYHHGRQRSGALVPSSYIHGRLWRRHPLEAGLAGILGAWLLAMLFTQWGFPARHPVPADVTVDRIDVGSVGVSGLHCLVQVSFTVGGAPVELRPRLEGPALPPSLLLPPPPHQLGAAIEASPPVLPGASSAQQQRYAFAPGTHTWTIDFVLPSEEQARAAAKALLPISPMRALRQAHRAVLFEVADANGGEVSRAVLDFQVVPNPVMRSSADFGTRAPLAPWLLLGAMLLFAGGVFAVVIWGIRAVFKTKATGCIVALVLLLVLLLLGFLLPVVYGLLSKRSQSPPASASSSIPTSETALEDPAQEEPSHAAQAAAPGPDLKNKPIITLPGTYPLNKRFTLHVPGKPMRGKDGAITMRSYTLRSKLDDGASGVTTFAPLAIGPEAFAIWWDEDMNHLWLASPSVLRWHHLPEAGAPADKLFMLTEIPYAYWNIMPQPMREALAAWGRHEGDKGSSSTVGDRATPDSSAFFLKVPQRGTLNVIAELSRRHDFESPRGPHHDCFRLRSTSAVSAQVWATKGMARQDLPWDKEKWFNVTLTWHQNSGTVPWIELISATPAPSTFTPPALATKSEPGCQAGPVPAFPQTIQPRHKRSPRTRAGAK